MTLGRLQFSLDLFTGLVIASIAVALAFLTWRIGGFDDGRTEVAIANAPGGGAAAVDVTPILLLSPFGSAISAAPAAAGAGSSLGLSLRGIILAVPRNASAALIAASDGAVVAYGVGQTVSGGAVVEAIEMDHVVLRVGAGTEVLAFPDPSAPAGAAPGTTPVAPPAVPVVPPSASGAPAIPPSISGVPPPVVPATPPGATPGAAPAPGTTGAILDELRRQGRPGSQTMLDGLGMTPSEGGYRVGSAPSPQALAAGLQPGDLIERVDGTAVAGNPASDRQALERAVTTGRAQVEVIRGGRRLTLTLPLR